jgi:predicted nucleotidyltransferase
MKLAVVFRLKMVFGGPNKGTRMHWDKMMNGADWDAQVKNRWDASAAERRQFATERVSVGELADADWWQRQAKRAERMPAYQSQLLTRERKFLSEVVRQVLAIVPDAEQIWLHGSRAINEHKRTSDWDFLVFVPVIAPGRRVELHARGGGQLGDLAEIAGREVDVQAEEISDVGNLVRTAREEGILVWRAA